MVIQVNHNVFRQVELYVFGSLFLVRMVIQLVNQKQNVNLGYVKMLNLLLIVIFYVDNLKMNVQSIILIMVVLRDLKHVLNTQYKINVLVF